VSNPKVVEIGGNNFRDPVKTLRRIADEIEFGEYGDVGCLGVVLLGSRMEVFRAGIDAEPCSVALLLHSGFLRMSQEIEKHGS
jgi:hypothetical protein